LKWAAPQNAKKQRYIGVTHITALQLLIGEKTMPTIPRKEYLIEAILLALALSMVKIGGSSASPILDIMLIFMSLLILSLIFYLPKPG
jgi:hypothetical protein